MASYAIQRRRGTATEHGSFTGLAGELTVNTTRNSVHVHDGSQAGGHELAKIDLSNVASTSIGAHLLPSANVTYNLGSSSKMWGDIYVGPSTLYINGVAAMGVDSGSDKEEGAGDQGIMFGFACKDTDTLMPAPIHYSHQILYKMAEARKNGSAPGLEPDSKSQVTMLYENGKPTRVTSLVISSQHKEGLSPSDVKEIVKPYVYECIPNQLLEDLKDEEFYVNPTGNFVIGGPDGDSGLTGRKIIVDTYGGAAPHGGGAFSGKDPSKVDRSAAYAARYLAKNIVAADLADQCTIQLSYAIGVSKPISVYVNTNGTNKVDEKKIESSVQDMFDLSPRGIREQLKLTNAIYVPTSAYGHFGRTPTDEGHFSWEKTDLVDSLKSLL